MTLTPDRWITTVFRHPDKRYYVRTVDIETRTKHYFFIYPNATLAKPATYLDHPGTYIPKPDIPPSIRQVIIAYLAELEKDTGQMVMKI